MPFNNKFIIIIIFSLLSCESVENLDRELISAVSSGNEEHVIELLRDGANTDAYDKELDFYALSLAVLTNNTKIASVLLENGSNIEQLSQSFTPLMLAVDNNKQCEPKLVKTLLSYGAKINQKTFTGVSALSMAVAKPNNKKCIDILLDNGADIHVIDEKQGSILHHAVLGGDADLIKHLLQKGLDPNYVDKFGYTPITSTGSGLVFCLNPKAYLPTLLNPDCHESRLRYKLILSLSGR